MDALTLLTQCGFCSHLTSAMLSRCDLCGDRLTPNNLVSMHQVYSAPPVAEYCQTCGRRLLLNNQSCTFCNAVYSASPVGVLPITRQPRIRPPPLRMVDILTDMVSMHVLENVSEPTVQPLLPDVRDQLLQPLPEHVTLETDAVCPVCIENFGDRSTTPAAALCQLPCCHNTFHSTCLQRWFLTHHTCPMCRRNLNDRLVS